MDLLTDRVSAILDKLDKAGVEYLEFYTYNKEDFSTDYQSEYIDLLAEIVVRKIFKHFGINPLNNETIVNYFAKENGKWIVSFYEPDVCTTIEKILNNDYSELVVLGTW